MTFKSKALWIKWWNSWAGYPQSYKVAVHNFTFHISTACYNNDNTAFLKKPIVEKAAFTASKAFVQWYQNAYFYLQANLSTSC